MRSAAWPSPNGLRALAIGVLADRERPAGLGDDARAQPRCAAPVSTPGSFGDLAQDQGRNAEPGRSSRCRRVRDDQVGALHQVQVVDNRAAARDVGRVASVTGDGWARTFGLRWTRIDDAPRRRTSRPGRAGRDRCFRAVRRSSRRCAVTRMVRVPEIGMPTSDSSAGL